jgi:hypothetical protein
VLAEMVQASEKAADPGPALKTVGKRHLLEQQARAERESGGSAAAAAKPSGSKPAKALTPEEVSQARAHVQKGMAASDAGRDDEALAELAKAWEITEDARLFFYVGSIHDRAGRVAEAIAAYQRYVAEGKVGPQQAGPVRKRIQALEAQAARAAQEPTPLEEAGPAAPPEPPAAAEPPPERSGLPKPEERRLARRLAAARRAEKDEQHYAAFLELRAAYRISPEPEILGRLARAADRAGRPEAAELYRRYLAEADVPPAERDAIEKRLEALENASP